MTHVLRIGLACIALLAASPALADGVPPVKDKAPPADAPKKAPVKNQPEKKAPENAKTTETKKPFDLSELGARDAASDKDVKGVLAGCSANMMSREGPTAKEEAKCNAAIARVVARGKKAVPSVLAELNRGSNGSNYYAHERLFFALSRLDDETLRNVLVGGMVLIATEELEQHANSRFYLAEALFGMMGARPDPEVPWEPAPVRAGWEDDRSEAAAWKAFVKEHEGKKRSEIIQERLARARKEKADDDPKKAYWAISYLAEKSPAEAVSASKAYLKRQGLSTRERTTFEDLQRDAELRRDEAARAAAGKK